MMRKQRWMKPKGVAAYTLKRPELSDLTLGVNRLVSPEMRLPILGEKPPKRRERE